MWKINFIKSNQEFALWSRGRADDSRSDGPGFDSYVTVIATFLNNHFTAKVPGLTVKADNSHSQGKETVFTKDLTQT